MGTKAVSSRVPLKSITFTWVGSIHTLFSSFTSWSDAETAILTIIARATDPVRVDYHIEWTD